MRSFILRDIWLVSQSEKAARHVSFAPEATVILGTNDTGKSSLLKAIYGTFGASAARVNPKWSQANAASLVRFTLDGDEYHMLKYASIYALFNAAGEKLWSTTSISRELAEDLARLFGFNLLLGDRRGNMIVPAPAYFFLPSYIDQDVGWTASWASFSNLLMLPNFKRDAAYFLSGLRPKEYYQAKSVKLAAEKIIEELRADRRALSRAEARLRAGRTVPKPDIAPEQFDQRVEAVLRGLNALVAAQNKLQQDLADLHSQKMVLIEQAELAARTANELEADYNYLQEEHGAELICPTCGTYHQNSFANRFGLVTDLDSCRELLVELRAEMALVDVKIATTKQEYSSQHAVIAAINASLDEQRGEVKLRDLIEGESERLVDRTLEEEHATIDEAIGEQDRAVDVAAGEMAKYTNAKRSAEILTYYRNQMASALMELDVPNLEEKHYRSIDCVIKETGSDFPRALLAYYYAFLSTSAKYSTTTVAPIVMDSPVQQEQDVVNAKRVIDFALKKRPAGVQLVLGAVSLHGADFNGKIIEFSDKYALLSADQFEHGSRVLKPFVDQLIG